MRVRTNIIHSSLDDGNNCVRMHVLDVILEKAKSIEPSVSVGTDEPGIHVFVCVYVRVRGIYNIFIS